MVIFDEFHERSLHADLGLALCLDVQNGLREDLRLMVMSATLDTQAISRLLGDAPVIESEGRMYPVETRYSEGDLSGNPVLDATAAVLKALREETGSILVFLPGAGEIKGLHRRLGEAGLGSSTLVVPLYGALSRAAQAKAIEPAPPGLRKVVLATAIAETSLTIEGVRIVIDAGLMRVPRYDVRSAMTGSSPSLSAAIRQTSGGGARGESHRASATAFGPWEAMPLSLKEQVRKFWRRI